MIFERKWFLDMLHEEIRGVNRCKVRLPEGLATQALEFESVRIKKSLYMILNPFNSNICLFARISFEGNSKRTGSGKHGYFLWSIRNDSYKTVVTVAFTRPRTNMQKAMREAAASLPLRLIRKTIVASGNCDLVKKVTKDQIVKRFGLPFYDSEATVVFER